MYAWLLAAIWPLAKKVLLALGIGFLTYEGVTTLVNVVITNMQTLWGGVTTTFLQFASLMGIPEAMGIMCGAMVARATIVAVGKIGRVAA